MATQLLDRLREAIISGQLEAGSKINLSKARESFEVSLSPLREALARLIADGLVEFEDNRGYRVAPVSLSNLEESPGFARSSRSWPYARLSRSATLTGRGM